MQNLAKIVLLSLVLIATACANHESSSSSGPGTPPPLPQPHGDSTTNDLEFEHFAIIREMSGGNAALFGILPSAGKFEIKSAAGPAFLTPVRSGELTVSALDKFFPLSPMSVGEKQNLLAKFKGATVVYIENYKGTLCDEQRTDFTLVGTVEQTYVVATFQFEALPDPSGECTFHILGLEARLKP